MNEPPSAVSPSPAPTAILTVEALLERVTPRAWCTPALVVLIVAAFVFELARGVSLTAPTAVQLLSVGADFGPSVYAGQFWRPLTSMFLHAGALHLAFNVWVLWRLGRVTERVFGNGAYLTLYFLSGIGASLTSLAWKPMTVSVGASGAIFGVCGALLSFALLHRGVLPVAYLQRRTTSLLAFLGYNLLFGLAQTNTDMAAHAGGLVTGLLAGALLGRDLRRPSANVGRRVAGATLIAAFIGAGAFAVHLRLGRDPVIRADRITKAAYARLTAKDYGPAIAGFTEALALGGSQQYLLGARGYAYAMDGKLDLAEKDLLAATASAATPGDLARLCEVSWQRAGGPETYETVEGNCTRAIAVTESAKLKAQLLVYRGTIREARKHLDEALADADAAIALDDAQSRARALHARVLVVRGETDAAEADCALLLVAKSPPPLDVGLCAGVAAQRKDQVASRARIEQWIALTPNDARALVARATVRQEDGSLDDARADLEHAVAVAPDLAIGWNNLAWLRVSTADFAHALQDADRAVAIEPDSPSILGTRCFALAGLDRNDEARRDCARAVALHPDGRADRGMVAYLDRRYGDARKDWQAALEEESGTAAALRFWMKKLPRH